MTEKAQIEMRAIIAAIEKSEFKILNRYSETIINITRRKWYNQLIPFAIPLSGFGKVEMLPDGSIEIYPWLGIGYKGLPELGKIIAEETGMKVMVL